MSESDKMFAPQTEGRITNRFSLLLDKADDDVIDSSLRSGVELRGATPWILMFAILVASIGLNINSPAVIIGAMLISPLMGPIVGIGYGIGIYDFTLIRRSLANLGIAAGISLATSTLYFLLTPLDEAQSELLARTTPTLWDVLIALTGGLAGIIGMTRREKSNVIPGVAIATALMPPLCTAGYGLANANWAVFGGAFYLFSINCVFIAVATVIVIEYLRLPHRKFVDQRVERRVKRTLLMVVMLTGLPSIYLAIQLVDNEVFGNRARQFVRQEFSGGASHVVDTSLSPLQRRIELTLIGARMPAAAIAAIEKKLPQAGLEGATLVVNQAEDSRVDVGVLKADILAEIYRDTQEGLRERDATIAQLREELARRDAQRDAWRGIAADTGAEFVAQYPDCKDVLMGLALLPARDDQAASEVPTLTARCTRTLAPAEVQRAQAWLVARTKTAGAQLMLIPPARRR
ncbi:DUF389 domain-containing protein [Massilia consociata]|uniref:DUF389 domain-containing protein n=1 Tax=Massilia consociata TaxID=760117 RepID=A0ABV6FCR6_9BURK